MSYTLSLQCGCTVYVSCHPLTGVAHTRLIERRGPACGVRRHEVGLRLYLWEILPDRESGPAPDGRVLTAPRAARAVVTDETLARLP